MSISMRNRILLSFVVFVSSLILNSCGPAEQAEAPWRVAIDSLQNHYAPDGRLAVFKVSWRQQGDMLIVRGEVDNAKAKDDALATVRKASETEVVDSVMVLPDPQLRNSKFGIVAVSVANVRSRPSHAAELSTQALMEIGRAHV
jgi:hypothetical protein